MTGYLYFNGSNYNVAKKNIIALSNEINIVVKNESEVVNPTIILSSDYEVISANYLYIEDLNRYYYINEKTLEHQRFILKCHVDVLMSFYDQLKPQRFIVERNGTHGNLYLEDTLLKCFAKTRFQTFPWLDSNGQPVGFRASGSKVKNFILTVSGSGESSENNQNEGGGE